MKGPPAPKGKKAKKPVTDDDVLTFEQKKDLSDTISKLDGAKLERVIQIIHEGVPEIRDVSAQHGGDRTRTRSATSSRSHEALQLRHPATEATSQETSHREGYRDGWAEEKRMDEDVETKKIRALEEKLKSFEQGGSASDSE
ncbi:hypothetical protein ONZ51_g7474 [Trametes cubensis]|uniref:NET domain-containing protein n=1 Tax=Trametes cubensis TaxID=1111947 RepID=A0AAD7XA55_9APHY|nr:hypothetical protein ONZ51_g7474 [Trametes cubensis]